MRDNVITINKSSVSEIELVTRYINITLDIHYIIYTSIRGNCLQDFHDILKRTLQNIKKIL